MTGPGINGRNDVAEREPPQDDTLLGSARFLELAEGVLRCQDMEGLAAVVLPWMATLFESPKAFLYIDQGPPAPSWLHQHGLTPHEASEVEAACHHLPSSGHWGSETLEPAVLPGIVSDYRLWPLGLERGMRGILGARPSASTTIPAGAFMPRLLGFLGHAVETVLDRMRIARQIAYFNTYLTVSSLLAKSMGLHQLLETVLYFCTEAVSAEEASALFLDEDRKNFHFFQTEGPSRSALSDQYFPADEGIAGAVLRARKSEIIHDVQNDPRFYGKFDTKSGVVTRNMIVIPLVAEDEPVGVLEVINKVGGVPFTEEDRLLLHFIADEIAFAVRNARIFEIVVDSYCKQRQGQQSCQGCKRPLGSWTPCVKYREGP